MFNMEKNSTKAGAKIWIKGFKSYLPVKLCVTCGLKFAWRKKWAKNWEKVKYCSEKCRKFKSHTKKEL
jgi:hypothetical protein